MVSWISDSVFGPGGLWESREAFEAELRDLTDSSRVEWIDDKVVGYPPRPPIDGPLAFAASFHIDTYLQQKRIGQTFRPSPAFLLRRDPARLIRIPDVAYFSLHRLAQVRIEPLCNTPPDLIVEVITQPERRNEIEERIRDFFRAGTTMAWIVDFVSKSCEVRRARGECCVFRENDKVKAAPLLPRLNLGVYEFFEMFQ